MVSLQLNNLLALLVVAFLKFARLVNPLIQLGACKRLHKTIIHKLKRVLLLCPKEEPDRLQLEVLLLSLDFQNLPGPVVKLRHLLVILVHPVMFELGDKMRELLNLEG